MAAAGGGRPPLPLKAYISPTSTAQSHEANALRMQLLGRKDNKGGKRTGAGRKRGSGQITRTQWVHVANVDLKAIDCFLDELQFDTCVYSHYLHPRAQHGTFRMVPCIVLPGAVKNTCLVRRVLRCSGACKCEAYGKLPCRVMVKLEIFSAEPNCWVISRNHNTVPVSESSEHAPANPSAFQPGKRRMSLALKAEIETAVTNRVSPAKFLASKSNDALMANTAVQNGLPVTEATRRIADLKDTKYHPPQHRVYQSFKDAKKRRRIHQNDAHSFDTMTRQLSGLHGWTVVHQQGSPTQDEVVVLVRKELALHAIQSCMGFGWDASASLNSYGFKHWELTAMSTVDGSLKGVSIAVATSSGTSTRTQTFLVECILSSITRVGVEEGVLARGVIFRPTVVCIDKDACSKDAWKSVCPDIVVIYCLWHLNNWLTPVLATKENGVPLSDRARVRAEIMKLAAARTEVVFNELLDKYRARW
jgi:hypothetical protein